MVPTPRSPRALPPPSAETPQSQVLPTDLPKELLRGVALHIALEGFAKHWRSGGGQDEMLELSRPTPVLDAFVSHDWGTSRRAKYFTMLIIYNSRVAFLVSGYVSVLSAIVSLSWTGRSPLGFFVTFVPYTPLTFYICLFFWQPIRACFARPFLVFVDKMCISQKDPSRKEAAIMGLAAFLLKSRRMIILWSPKYFQRLWCTYELGTFLQHQSADDPKELEIMPVALGVILLELSIFTQGITFCIYLGSAIIDHVFLLGLDLSYELFFAAICVVLLFLQVPCSTLLKMMHDLEKLPDQLAQFSMRDSQCFCCSVDHCRSETGEIILCDRQLVYSTIRSWFSESNAEPLDAFDRNVRTKLKQVVTSQLGSGHLPVPYFLYMTCAPFFLSLPWYMKDIIWPSDMWLMQQPSASKDVLWRIGQALELPSTGFVIVATILPLCQLVHLTCGRKCSWLASLFLVVLPVCAVAAAASLITFPLTGYAKLVAQLCKLSVGIGILLTQSRLRRCCGKDCQGGIPKLRNQPSSQRN
ncbi:unnamed protein product [Symbiodinium sp. CCMP2592]|nr:unnamed protein product [Symbiodinium sp. CCMP2592]